MVAGLIVNYPNQLGSILSDPLTHWWGMTLCPPELNDVLLAESVILMRYAAITEMNLNTEVQKPSLEEVLEFQAPRMDCTEAPVGLLLIQKLEHTRQQLGPMAAK